jgi:ferric-dicitrate binding protein FerR (iron transport regulator)
VNTSELLELGRRVADEQNRALGAQRPDESARRALADHAATHGARRNGRRIAVRACLAAALVMSSIAVVVLLRGSDEPLTFRVNDLPTGSVSPDWVTAESADVRIRFSDGTSFVLHPGARARVANLSERGADVVLESGAAAVSIVPDGQGRWQIRSGPFEVRVHGTRFDITWDPAHDRFQLWLYAGKVVLAGCVFGNGHPVASGQEVTASCSRRELSVKPIGATRPTAIARTAASPAVAPARRRRGGGNARA